MSTDERCFAVEKQTAAACDFVNKRANIDMQWESD
jgi:hypothetical protein